MVDNEPTAPDGQPRPLRATADLPGLLALVRDVVRQLAKSKMGPLLAAREAPSDLAQTVVLELLAHADRIEDRGEASTRALARTMLVRKLADRVRAAQAHKRGAGAPAELPANDDSLPAPATPAAAGRDPSSVVAGRDLVEHLGRLAKRLSLRERAVFELRIEGKSHAEIAKALGISADYSQRLLAGVRKKLQDARE